MHARTLTDPDDSPVEDKIVVLHGATWADYERLMEIRGEKSSPRIAYMEGALEIMSPSKTHEKLKSKIGRLVEVWCLEKDISFDVLGSWTLKDKSVERGVEADACYGFGDKPDAERPDLAIEVVWTSGGLDKLELDRKLNVKELWFWRRGKITVHVLRCETYVQVLQSEALQGIDLEQLASFLDQPASAGMRAYRDALRGD